MTDSAPTDSAPPETRPLPGLDIRRQGAAAIITLDRPAALNALDLAMVRGMTTVLTAWADDPAVRTVVVRSGHPRAFCAGGDIRAVRADSLAGRFDAIEAFFAEEYALDCLVGAYPKPYVALIDGFCMGGGMGISMHGPHRVAAEGAVFSMPETLIGFFPDVGASHFLPRLGKGIGLFLGLTGLRADAADAVALGIATAFVPRAAHGELIAALAGGADAATAIARLATPAPAAGPLGAHRDFIARVFGDAPSALAIVERLAGEDGAFAASVLESLRAMSPTSLAVTFELIRQGAGLTLPQATALELRVGRHVTRMPDFIEGVRAALVDKDRTPRWQPARLEDVDPAAVAALFA